jgi:hypothetical protein
MDSYPLLKHCLYNFVVREDIGHQDKEHLIETLINGRKLAGKDWLDEFDEGLPKS